MAVVVVHSHELCFAEVGSRVHVRLALSTGQPRGRLDCSHLSPIVCVFMIFMIVHLGPPFGSRYGSTEKCLEIIIFPTVILP